MNPMHGYVFEDDAKRHFPWWLLILASVSSFAAWYIFRFLRQHQIENPVPWIWDGPTAFALLAALYWLFDRWLWSLPIIHFLFMAQIPNLNGEWKVNINPQSFASTGGKAKELEGTFKVTQTFSQINITLEITNVSTSHSLTAAIRRRDDGKIEVRNQYSAEAISPAQAEHYHNHEGTNFIVFVAGKCQRPIQGNYYTDWRNHTFGQMEFREKIG